MVAVGSVWKGMPHRINMHIHTHNGQALYLPTVTIMGPAMELGKLKDSVMILME